MWNKMIFIFIVFIVFTSVKCNLRSADIIKLQNNLSKTVTSERIDENFSKVHFNNASWVIYFYDKKKDEDKSHIDKYRSNAVKFFISMNCEFADWIQRKLLKFVKLFPTVYSRISNFQSKYSNIFYKSREKCLKYLSVVIKHTKRFINILLNFIKINSYNSMIDTGLVKSLFSLQFKFNFIKTLHIEENNDDDPVITLILKTLNDFQHFVAYNCDISSYDDNRNYLGYPMFILNSSKVNIIQYLYQIREIDFETPYEQCDVNQMLLEDFVATQYFVSNDTSKLNISLDCGSVEIKDIYKEASLSYNLYTIYWYQKIVFSAIMKLICYKTLEMLRCTQFVPVEITTGYNTILEFISPNFMNLPEKLVACFKRLAKKIELSPGDRSSMTKAINDYLETIGKEKNEDCMTLTLPNFKVDITDEQLHLGLQEFMEEILEKIDSYKCFIYLFEFLHNQFGRYYVIHNKNPKEVYSFMYEKLCKQDQVVGPVREMNPLARNEVRHMESKLDDSDCLEDNYLEKNQLGFVRMECQFVTDLYQLCFETIISLKMVRESYMNDSDKYLRDIGKNISAVKKYISNLSEWHLNRGLNTIVFDLLPNIELLGESNLLDKYDSFLRLLYLGMTELNNYSIEHCRPSKHSNYVLFDNFAFGEVGLHKNIENRQEAFMWLLRQTRPKINELPTFKELYGYYKNGSNEFKSYDDKLRFYWKGEKATIGEIFANVEFAVSSSFYVYALCDVFYKFSFATLLYNLVQLFGDFEAYTSNQNFENCENCGLYVDQFPNSLSECVRLYNDYLSNFFSREMQKNTFARSTEFEQLLINELESLGVFIKLGIIESSNNKTKKKLTKSKTKYMYKNYEKSILKLRDFLKTIKDWFMRYRMFYHFY